VRRRQLDAEMIRSRFRDPVQLACTLGHADTLRPNGRGCMIHCPFHSDSTPSCSLYVGTDGTVRFKCFGCDARGDIFAFMARGYGMDLKEQFRRVLKATEEFADEMDGLVPAGRAVGGEYGTDAGLVDEFTLAAMITTLLVLCPLASQSDVAAYLSERGIREQAERDGWGALPPLSQQNNIIAQLMAEFGPETVAGTGLVGASGGFVWPEHRLLTPWRSPSSWLVTLQRRLIRAARDGEPRYVTLRGHPAPFPYGIDGLTAEASVAIVEGAIDALSLRELCERHEDPRAVLGVPGTSNWRREWARIATGRVVYIALDADAAGENAVSQIERDVRAAGAVQVLRSKPLGGKDWNDALVGSRS
jgi:DNA primase